MKKLIAGIFMFFLLLGCVGPVTCNCGYQDWHDIDYEAHAFWCKVYK